MRTGTLCLLAVLALCGCASGPAPTPSSASAATPFSVAPAAPQGPAAPPPPTAAQQKTATASMLAVERQWLASWFKGTPVVIAQQQDGAVVVDVPREFCFDKGRDAVKPALAAVLDKVAESLRRTASAELHLIAAPADASGAQGLALQRGTRVYDYLRTRGVAPARLTKPTVSPGNAVQLRIEAPSPA
jgi:outer membrane protein OmpA-like peptidoglycan-associated protein